MIRVLHIISSMNRGGAESFIMNLYRNIDRTKVQFDFLLHTSEKSDYAEEIKQLGGKIFTVSSRKESLIQNRKDLNNFFLKHNEYKVIHQHLSSLSYIEPLKIAHKFKVPVRILHGHSTREGGSIIHKYIHMLNKRNIQKYTTYNFVCSDTAAQWLFKKKDYSSANYIVVNNGIEVEEFTYSESKRKEMRENLGLQDNFVIGNVGNFVYPKNHKFLLDIFKEIYQENNKARLLLIGEGTLRDEIEKKVKIEGLESSVIILGKRSDISLLMHAMDVFVMPSHFEGLPVTLVEAQTNGLPCIVSDNITNLVDITENIIHLSLNESPMEWKKEIEKINRNFERKNLVNLVRQSGFDIKKVSSNLEKMYLNC